VSDPQFWRTVGARLVFIALALDVLGYLLKLAIPWRLVSAHESFVVVTDEVGLFISVLTLFGAAICLRGWKMAAAAIGSLVIGYFWFAGVAWWVMVK
jgi:hypothetical protein